MTATCTVTMGAVHGGRCGKPAVWTNGTFAECADHAADIGALARHAPATTGHAVGDFVDVHRYGKTYRARITRVGARGAAYATFTYGNGATRTVRV